MTHYESVVLLRVRIQRPTSLGSSMGERYTVQIINTQYIFIFTQRLCLFKPVSVVRVSKLPYFLQIQIFLLTHPQAKSVGAKVLEQHLYEQKMLDRSALGLPPLSSASLADPVMVSRLQVDLSFVSIASGHRSQVKVRCLVTLFDIYHKSNEVSILVENRREESKKSEKILPKSVTHNSIVEEEENKSSALGFVLPSKWIPLIWLLPMFPPTLCSL